MPAAGVPSRRLETMPQQDTDNPWTRRRRRLFRRLQACEFIRNFAAGWNVCLLSQFEMLHHPQVFVVGTHAFRPVIQWKVQIREPECLAAEGLNVIMRA